MMARLASMLSQITSGEDRLPICYRKQNFVVLDKQHLVSHYVALILFVHFCFSPASLIRIVLKQYCTLCRWFGVKLSQECRNAVFSFTMSSSMHHLRTAYSQDGNSWTCASDYRDTGVGLFHLGTSG